MPCDHKYCGECTAKAVNTEGSSVAEIGFQLKSGGQAGLTDKAPAEQRCVWAELCLERLEAPSCWRPPHGHVSLLPPSPLHCPSLRSWPQASGMPRTPGMYVRQPPAPDPARPETDGHSGTFTSIHGRTGSCEGKQGLFTPSLISWAAAPQLPRLSQ